MKPLPWSLRLYIVAVVAAGALLLSYLTPRIEFPNWWDVLFWGLMILLPEFLSVTLPRGGAAITVGFAIEYACIITLGPALTVWLAIFGSLIIDGLIRKVPIYKFSFNTFQFILTVGLAGLVFQLTGGVVGSPDFGLFVIPLILCALTYFVVNTGTTSIAIGLHERTSPLRSWTANYRWMVVNYLGLGVFGVLMALIYLKIGSWGAALFLVPLLIARYVFKLYIDIKEEHWQTITALMSAVDAKDGYFGGHSHRVRNYASAIARDLGLPEPQVEIIEYAALLHDVGRVKISESLLLKPASLTPSEWAIMREHPATAEEIIAPLTFLKKASKIVRHHHERPNGEGYPDGLKSDETPLGAKIIKVADAYDAMTHDRPYREALSTEEAVEELQKNKGIEFHPSVVDSLLRLLQNGGIEE